MNSKSNLKQTDFSESAFTETGEIRGSQTVSMRKSPENRHLIQGQGSLLKRRAWSLFFIALSAAFAWALSLLWADYVELGPAGFLNHLNPLTWQASDTTDFHLRDDSLFEVKKKQKLFGMQVYRITSKQQPQEFLLVTGVSSSLLNQVFDKPIDRFWMNQIAQQLLRLRIGTGANADDSSTAKEPGIEVQSVIPEPSRNLIAQDKSYPYWQLKLKLQLSTETIPRYYQVGILRSIVINQSQQQGDKENILIAYAPENAFQSSNLLSLLKQTINEP
jgi:hypothetical protein